MPLEFIRLPRERQRARKLANALDAYQEQQAGAPTKAKLEAAILRFVDKQLETELTTSPSATIIDAIGIVYSVGHNPFRDFSGLSNIVDDAVFILQAQETRTQAQELQAQPPAFSAEAYDAEWGTDLASSIGELATVGQNADIVDLADYRNAKSA